MMNFYKNSQPLRALVLCGAMLILSVTASNSAFAQNCSTNCLSVFSADLTNVGTSIRGIVKLVDETGSGGGARGTVVHAVWTRPDGTTMDQYANIGTRLRATFNLFTGGAPGTYSLTVADATKAGYQFDPSGGVSPTVSISIGDPINQAPMAVFNTDVTSGAVPLVVNFDSSGSNDPDGMIMTYDWNFGDGTGSSEALPSHTYTSIGNFTTSLTVIDNMGTTDSQSSTITVSSSDAGCSSNCMSVDRISMRYKKKTNIVKGLVWVVDENDTVVKNAKVHVIWTLPDGSTSDQYKNIGNRQKAVFKLNATQAGSYALTVVEVTRDGYEFDADNSNALSSTISVTP